MYDERYICNFDFIIENYYYSEHRINNDDTIYTYDGLDNVNMTLSTTGSIQKKYEYSDYGEWSLDSKTEIINNEFDIVLSHTAPLKYEPVEMFLAGVDQSRVDKSTEEWLDDIENMISYNKWYFGHYHGDSVRTNKVTMLFHKTIEIE